MPAESEEIGMARSIEQSPWEAYEALVESITQNADPADGWDSGSDIEAVLYVRHLEGEVERLRDLVGQHDPTGADHLAEMMEHAQRADALYDENKRLRDALRVILAGLSDALGDPMGARPSQVTTLYSIASHAMRPIQSGSSGGEG